jgi:hypothetical protein
MQNSSSTNSLTRTRSGAYGDRPQKASLARIISRAASLITDVRSTIVIDLEAGEDSTPRELAEVDSSLPSTIILCLDKKSSTGGSLSTTTNVS